MKDKGGNVALTQTAAGSDGTGDTSGIADTLLAGDLSVYINDPTGLFTSDELARIRDALNAWDAILAPYNVTITEVSDPTLANIVIDTGIASACGGAADGVLGCFNAPNASARSYRAGTGTRGLIRPRSAQGSTTSRQRCCTSSAMR
jgi:hypothetical protein